MRVRWAQAEEEEGVLGPDSVKIRRVGGRTFLYAEGDPASDTAEWYDFTGALIPPDELQYGIGKNTIRPIDDPLFVSPDDRRLLEMIPSSSYRFEAKPESVEDIWVIGYVEGGQAKAYPVALLDHHELVNDTIGGKPITVGW
jgi:hypothetical protein